MIYQVLDEKCYNWMYINMSTYIYQGVGSWKHNLDSHSHIMGRTIVSSSWRLSHPTNFLHGCLLWAATNIHVPSVNHSHTSQNPLCIVSLCSNTTSQKCLCTTGYAVTLVTLFQCIYFGGQRKKILIISWWVHFHLYM